ncbi:hypothetical protein D9M72_318060 [compost metagenome]
MAVKGLVGSQRAGQGIAGKLVQGTALGKRPLQPDLVRLAMDHHQAFADLRQDPYRGGAAAKVGAASSIRTQAAGKD